MLRAQGGLCFQVSLLSDAGDAAADHSPGEWGGGGGERRVQVGRNDGFLGDDTRTRLTPRADTRT